MSRFIIPYMKSKPLPYSLSPSDLLLSDLIRLVFEADICVDGCGGGKPMPLGGKYFRRCVFAA